MKPSTFLAVAGIAAVLAGAGWYRFGRPSDTEQRTREVLCAMRGDVCDELAGPVAGPAVLAVAGAFLILLGAILHAGRRP
jgi:integral membrane sensor domain MASE1